MMAEAFAALAAMAPEAAAGEAATGLGAGFGMGLAPEAAAGTLAPIAGAGIGASMIPSAMSFGIPSPAELSAMANGSWDVAGDTGGLGGLLGNAANRAGNFARTPMGTMMGLQMLAGGNQQPRPGMPTSPPMRGPSEPVTSVMSSFYGQKPQGIGPGGLPSLSPSAVQDMLRQMGLLGIGRF